MTTNSQASDVLTASKPWVERLARLGYFTKGSIYIIIGILAFHTASKYGGKAADPNAALLVISHEPFGRILTATAAVGLLGYVVWRWIQAFGDPEREGHDPRAILVRLGYFCSGLVYGTLGLGAVKILNGGVHPDHPVQRIAAHGLALPFGGTVVVVAGAVVCGLGIYSLFHAAASDFCKHLSTAKMGKSMSRVLPWLGRFGFAARGIVFFVIGVYLIKAGLHHDANAARGIDGAQVVLREWSTWALDVVAAGLTSFGAFMFVEARYNKIDLSR